MSLMSWHYVTSEQYYSGTKHEDDLYFLSDTKQIYRGNDPFTEAVIMYTTLPTTGIAVNRLYVNSDTLEGRIWTGSKWKVVIKSISHVVVEEIDDIDTGTTIYEPVSSPVSGRAVAAYVAAELAKFNVPDDAVSQVTWDSANYLLKITRGDESVEDIKFDKVGVSLHYDTTTGEMQLVDAKGNTIGDPVSLDLERFVSSGEYDPVTQKIILYFDEAKTESVEIPVGDLVDTYTAEGDNAIDLQVDSNNKITASIQISTAAGNLISVREDGLYVSVDLSNYVSNDKIVTVETLAASLEVASDSKVVSERLLMNSLTWKTEM